MSEKNYCEHCGSDNTWVKEAEILVFTGRNQLRLKSPETICNVCTESTVDISKEVGLIKEAVKNEEEKERRGRYPDEVKEEGDFF